MVYTKQKQLASFQMEIRIQMEILYELLTARRNSRAKGPGADQYTRSSFTSILKLVGTQKK